MKKTKNHHCWSCGTRLDRPLGDRPPAAHQCGQSDCVVCPKCGEPLCAYDPSAKAAKARKIKALAQQTPCQLASPGPSGGGGTASLPAVEPFPTDVFPPVLARF